MPNHCINLVKANLVRKFRICCLATDVGLSMYLSFSVLTNCAYDRKRLVYANSNNEIAENKKVGVISVISSILIEFVSSKSSIILIFSA